MFVLVMSLYAALFLGCWGCVHIRCCGYGGYWFRPYGGSLSKSAKVTKALLPHHSVPRLGSACPQSGIAPWARRDRPSMAVSRLPRHPCRGAHCAIPACGHRGLTGRLRSKARSKAEQQQSRGAKLHSPLWELACLRWRWVSGIGICTTFWVCVHIRCCGYGGYWFRSYSGSLLEKSPKSNQKGSCPTTRCLA